MLKKNFKRICRCLPLNYKDKFLGPLKAQVPNHFLSHLTSLDPEEFNEKTIYFLMMSTIRSNEDVLRFYDLLEQKADDKASAGVIEILRNGNLIIKCIANFVHMYVSY